MSLQDDDHEVVFGRAREAVRRYLTSVGKSVPSGVPLAHELRAHVHDQQNRANYVVAATKYLREKHPDLRKTYDVTLVGAGIHAAMFLYTARRTHPGLSALVVERSSNVCSTFSRLGDSLILNSPTSSKVGLDSNVAPGHFIQTSDFDELADRPFPTAKHLHELATMMIFHADADIEFAFDVEEVGRAGNGYFVSSEGRLIRSRSVVVCNGMGGPREASFARDRASAKILHGDDFIAACYRDQGFLRRWKDKTIAVVGAGDTANCVMEYLLPLAYPHAKYGLRRDADFIPGSVYWIGQNARNVQEYYFANKQRYCYSGGVIEFFWHGDSPFDLPVETWKAAKSLVRCIPDRLTSVSHQGDIVHVVAGGRHLDADLVVDCTGRFNELSSTLLADDYEFVEGDIVFCGGRWDRSLEHFVVSPKMQMATRIACRLKGERIFLLGNACPLGELIEDEEARDGSLRYQENRTSLTNSKWSLEHTLPRTVAFAERYADRLRDEIRPR